MPVKKGAEIDWSKIPDTNQDTKKSGGDEIDWSKIPDTDPQKKSPDVSVPGAADASQDGQTGVSQNNVSPVANSGVVHNIGGTESPLPPYDVMGSVFGKDATTGQNVISPERQINQTHEDIKSKTAAASSALINDALHNSQSLPSVFSETHPNPIITQPGNLLHDISNPAGDPAHTGNYIQSRIAQLEQEKQQAIQKAGYNDPELAGGLSDYGLSDINKQYNQQIEALKKPADHIVSLQLFNKEYAQKPLTDAEAQTKLDAITKQRDADIKNANDQMVEAVKGVDKYDVKKADDDRVARIKQINEEYTTEVNQVNNSKKWDAVRLGIEKQKLLGDPKAAQAAVAYNTGRPLDPGAKYSYQATGNEILKSGADNADANGQTAVVESAQKHIKTDRQLENDNQDYFNTQRAHAIGNAKYADENPLFRAIVPHFGAMSKGDVQDYGEQIGLSQSQIDKIDPAKVPTSSTIWQQFAKGALNTAAPLYERAVGRPLMAASGATDDQINQSFQPGWENERGLGAAITGNMPSDQNSFSNARGAIGQIFEGAGGLSTFAGEIGTASKAAQAVGLASDAAKAEHIANFGVMALTGYNNAYHDANEVIGDKPEDEWKRQVYALTRGIVEGKIFSIAPKFDMVKNALGEAEKGGNQLLDEINKAKDISVITSPSFKEGLAQKIQAIAKENGKQVNLAVANNIAKDAINTVADPNRKQDIPDEIKNTAISTSLAMLIPSILGGWGHVNSQTPLNTAAAFEIGSNPQPYLESIDKQYQSGSINRDDLRRLRSAIGVMQYEARNAPTQNIDGQALTPDQIKAYAFNRMQEHFLTDKVEAIKKSYGDKPEDKAITGPIKKKIADLEKQRTNILSNAGQTRPPTPQPEKPNQESKPNGANATTAEPEAQTSETKKTTTESENNIPLSPEQQTQQKTTENESTEIENNGQNSPNGQNRGNEENANPEEAGNGEKRNEQQEAGLLKPADETKPQTAATEQPYSVKPNRRRTKYVPPEEEIPHTQDPAWAAWNKGTEDGKPEDEVNKRIADADSDTKIGGGESFNEFKDRVQPAWEKFQKDGKDQSLLIAHSGVKKLIDAAEKVGWDNKNGELKNAYEAQEEMPRGEVETTPIAKGEAHIALHGEVEGQDKIARTPEAELTPKGEDQAKEIADQLKGQGITPKEIVSSDLIRSEKTGEIIQDEFAPEQKAVGAETEHPELVAINKELVDKKKLITDEAQKKIDDLNATIVKRDSDTLEIKRKKESYEEAKSVLGKMGTWGHGGGLKISVDNYGDLPKLIKAMSKLKAFGGDGQKIRDYVLNASYKDIESIIEGAYDTKSEEARIKVVERERDDAIAKAKNRRDYDYSEKQKELALREKPKEKTPPNGAIATPAKKEQQSPDKNNLGGKLKNSIPEDKAKNVTIVPISELKKLRTQLTEADGGAKQNPDEESTSTMEKEGIKEPLKVSRNRKADGTYEYYLTNGNHRLEEAERLGADKIPVEISEGRKKIKEGTFKVSDKNAAERKATYDANLKKAELAQKPKKQPGAKATFQKRKADVLSREPEGFREAVLQELLRGTRFNHNDITHDLGLSGEDLPLWKISGTGTKVDDFVEQFHNPDDIGKGSRPHFVGDIQEGRREFMDIFTDFASDNDKTLKELEKLQGRTPELTEEEYKAHQAAEKSMSSAMEAMNNYVEHGDHATEDKAAEITRDASENIPEQDHEKITEYFAGYLNGEGKLITDEALNPSSPEFKELYSSLSQDGRDLFDALLLDKEVGGWIGLQPKQEVDFQNLQKAAHEKAKERTPVAHSESPEEPAVDGATSGGIKGSGDKSNADASKEVDANNSKEIAGKLRTADKKSKGILSKLAESLGIKTNWNMAGEGDWLSGKKGNEGYTQRQLPDWNRAHQRGEINPESKITYEVDKGPYPSYVLAKDENGVTVGKIKISSGSSKEVGKNRPFGVEHLAVSPEFRGKGVADELYSRMKEVAPKLELKNTENQSEGFNKFASPIAIAEEYQKAKNDGSNPDFVKSVEDIIDKPNQPPNPERSVAENPKPEPQAPETKTVKSFETSKGSKYEILPDGRTKRFKTATGEENEPQDLTVFTKFKDEDQNQRFLRGIQDRENSGTKVYVIDKDGKIYNKNEEVKGKDVRLALVNAKTGETLETAKTTTEPTEGYNTFDQRRYTEDGQEKRESHIGNEVAKINYAEPEENKTDEKPNQEPKPNGAIATPAEPQTETPAQKATKEIAEIDAQLEKEKASQKLSGNKRQTALADKGIRSPEYEQHNKNWYKKQENIDSLERQKERAIERLRKADNKEKNESVFSKAADWIDKKYAENKKKHEGEAYSSILGMSPKIANDAMDFLVSKVTEGLRDLHNRDMAIRRGYRLLKEKYGYGGKDLDETADLKAMKESDLFSDPQLKAEPALSIANEEWAKDVLADVLSGRISHEDAKKEVIDEIAQNHSNRPIIAENETAKVLNYLDYHIQNDVESIKNATTRLRREQFGLNEETPAAKKEFGKTWDEAKEKIEDGYNPQHLVEELSKKARPLTDVENAILLHHQITKTKELNKLIANINKGAENGDQAAIAESKVAKARVLDELQQIYDVNKAVGTENARGLASRRMMADQRYSLVNMIAEKRSSANDGKPLSDEQQAQIEKLHEKITDAKQAFDDYKKNAESQIIDLQDKALKGKVKDKNKVSSKLREWADKIEKASKGQTFASPIPITPKMVADGMRLIADGIDKGGEIIDLVKHAIGKLSKANPGIDEQELKKEINKNLIDSGFLDVSPERRQAQFASGLFANGRLDNEAVRLKAAADRARAEYDSDLKNDSKKNLPFGNKAADFFVKLQRTLKLSSPLTMAKLITAGVVRIAMHPAEETVGGVYSKLLPKLAKGAIGEGGGLNVKAYASAIADGFKMWGEDARQIMKTGKSDIDVAFGNVQQWVPEQMEFFGQLHAAEKAPFKRSIFEYSLQKRLENSIAAGVDVTDPLVMDAIGIDAYKDGNRAIFMQDNKVADFYSKTVKQMEALDPTGKPESQAKYAISKAMQFLIPFAKIPSNIVAEGARYVYGLPVGATKAIYHAFNGDLETLAPEEKDMIMRNLKKGTIGAAALLYGFFKYNNFGGYYQPGNDWKKKKGQPDWSGATVGGVKIPQTYMEAPIFQAMQMGATFRKVLNHKVKGEPEGIPAATWAAVSGLAEENPLLSQPMHVTKLFESPYDRKQFLDEMAKSTLIPAGLSYFAKATDPADKGSVAHKIFAPENKRQAPKTVGESIESGIPGLREHLRKKL